MQADFDRELQSYFTDVEHLRDLFQQWLAAPALPRRMLIIHGVGGVGKSSLLRMFRLHCKSIRVPVALASGDEQKSAVEVLARWAEDLRADGVRLPEFSQTFQQYRALLARAESEAKKVAGKAVKGAARAVAGAALSTVPGLGPLLAELGGIGVDALTDILLSRGFKKPDVDLLLDPAKKLTADFLADLQKAAGRQRIVLMLDTFEQMTALEDWTCQVARQLHPNVLLVIAGRTLPDWGRAWPTWMASAQVEELRPMSEEDMRELIRRYYATLRGGEPDPKQIEAIIRFARGLPMVVTSVVRLWVKYRMENFEAVRPEVVADLTDRLLEGVSDELRERLLAAATLRWFHQSLLREVSGKPVSDEDYRELRLFPFVRSRAEGLALHDAVREIMDDYLKTHTPDRHRELHERAAAYFEKRLAKATGEEAERLGLERLYHRIRADEETGIQLFQEMAEELVRYRLVNRLRAVLNDVNTYPLERENSRLWREYYNARLAHLEVRLDEAKKVYQRIGENEQCEPRLRAYALCDLGEILSQRYLVVQPGGAERAIRTIQRSFNLMPKPDRKLVLNYWNLGAVYVIQAEHEKAIDNLKLAVASFYEMNDKYGVALMWGHLLERYRVIGYWLESFNCRQNGLSILFKLNEPRFLKAHLISNLLLFSTGRYAESEKELLEALAIKQNLGEVEIIGTLRDLGLVIGMQGKYDEAHKYFAKCFDTAKSLGLDPLEDTTALRFSGAVLLRQGNFSDAEERLHQSLSILRSSKYNVSIPEVFFWLGVLYETQSHIERASDCYTSNLDMRWTGRLYFHCGALTGLVRVKHAQGDYAAIPPLLAEAEQLAQQYEYNDHLASLRLTQGHIAWEGVGQVSNLSYGFDAALRYYQHALIYALRYNRFLLDEVLSGRPQGTPLRPIIPECLRRGEEGQRMLIALRDWWRTGTNDVGTPRPDTISPIPEGIPLLEAERIAREREPGDGSPQRSVVEQIEAALERVGSG